MQDEESSVLVKSDGEVNSSVSSPNRHHIHSDR